MAEATARLPFTAMTLSRAVKQLEAVGLFTITQIRLEVWEYDPKQFAKRDVADSLSVVLSFKDNEDERIEEAIEELLEMELKG